MAKNRDIADGKYIADNVITSSKLASNSVTSDKIVSASIQQEDLSIGASSIGVGQTWQDLTTSRSSGVTYTNTTGKPIMVNISEITSAGVSGAITVSVNSVQIAYTGIAAVSGSSSRPFASFTVPNGHTYLVTVSGGTIANWSELR